MEAARRPGEAVQTRFRRPVPGRLPAGERYWLWVWSISCSSVRQTRRNRYCRSRQQFLQWLTSKCLHPRLTSKFGRNARMNRDRLCKRFRSVPPGYTLFGGKELHVEILYFNFVVDRGATRGYDVRRRADGNCREKAGIRRSVPNMSLGSDGRSRASGDEAVRLRRADLL